MYSTITTTKRLEIAKQDGTIVDSWNGAYKVYANLDFDRDRKNCALEVIDGYLKEGESLTFNGSSKISGKKVRIFHFEIAKTANINTYFRTNHLDFLIDEMEHILVCIYRKNQLVGYQFFDHLNNLKGEPSFPIQEVLAVKIK
ncbi:MAG: hypothetical protein SGJ00_09670 [bacterium]|nr:hypothetical protein [bacterium]